MFGELGKIADKKPAAPATKTPAEPPAVAAAPNPPEPKDGDAPPVDPKADPKAPKPNPWKLYEESKKAILERETKIAELEKLRPTPERLKEIENQQARLKELEDEIQFVNFQKSQAFKDNYEKPYNDAWKKAMGELGELRLPDGEGDERPLNANDVLELVNLPLQEARRLAVEKFGDFADDVMQHRKEIRSLYDKQAAAIEEAKTKGVERDKQRQQEQQTQYQAVTKDIQDTWNQANEAAKTDEKYGKFFTPTDGDQDGNQRLSKGFELADRAFSENPMAPNLKPEDRKAIVARHAAVRNRAAAFGKLVYLNTKAEARIAELQAELGKYKQADPPAAGSRAPAAPAASGSKGWGGIRESLVKIAK